MMEIDQTPLHLESRNYGASQQLAEQLSAIRSEGS